MNFGYSSADQSAPNPYCLNCQYIYICVKLDSWRISCTITLLHFYTFTLLHFCFIVCQRSGNIIDQSVWLLPTGTSPHSANNHRSSRETPFSPSLWHITTRICGGHIYHSHSCITLLGCLLFHVRLGFIYYPPKTSFVTRNPGKESSTQYNCRRRQ